MKLRKHDPKALFSGLLYSGLGMTVGTVAGTAIAFRWKLVLMNAAVWLAFAGLLWFLFGAPRQLTAEEKRNLEYVQKRRDHFKKKGML